jgi:hypothetical protein
VNGEAGSLEPAHSVLLPLAAERLVVLRPIESPCVAALASDRFVMVSCHEKLLSRLSHLLPPPTLGRLDVARHQQ